MEGRGRYGHGVTGDRAPEVSVVILTTGAATRRVACRRRQRTSSGRSDRRDRGRRQRHVGRPRTAERRSGRIVSSAENLGIPGGRNFGATQAVAPVVAFLDDDARLIEVDTLAASASAFAANPQLGVVALRIVDDDGQTARRHVPRVGAGGADRSGRRPPSWVALSSSAAKRSSGLADIQPTSDMRWRRPISPCASSTTAGRSSTRAPAVVHPRTDPTRHPEAASRTMRSCVWLAYRNLPAPLAVVYVANWLVISAIRQPGQLAELFQGIGDGWSTRPRGQRAPIRWRTVVRLTRLGRPPIV